MSSYKYMSTYRSPSHLQEHEHLQEHLQKHLQNPSRLQEHEHLQEHLQTALSSTWTTTSPQTKGGQSRCIYKLQQYKQQRARDDHNNQKPSNLAAAPHAREGDMNWPRSGTNKSRTTQARDGEREREEQPTATPGSEGEGERNQAQVGEGLEIAMDGENRLLLRRLSSPSALSKQRGRNEKGGKARYPKFKRDKNQSRPGAAITGTEKTAQHKKTRPGNKTSANLRAGTDGQRLECWRIAKQSAVK